jgi:hypothetical protein
MFPPRRFVLRLTLALLGMALLRLVLYAGLGWAVWSDQIWLRALIGRKKFDHLQMGYAKAMAGLLPRDQDGDGVSDGIELFLRTGPQSPLSHPPLDIHWERGGFIAYDTASLNRGGSMDDFVFYDLLPQTDVPLRLRGRVGIQDGPFSFPRGFQLRLTPPPHGRLALPGGAPTEATLLVPIAADGSFAFDFHVRPSAPIDPLLHEEITVNNAGTGERFDGIEVRYLRVGSPRLSPVAVEVIPGAVENQTRTSHGVCRTIHLRWPSGNPSAQSLLLEAARDEADAEWFAIHLYPLTTTSCSVSLLLDDSGYPYTGPLKFRVVPIGPVAP